MLVGFGFRVSCGFRVGGFLCALGFGFLVGLGFRSSCESFRLLYIYIYIYIYYEGPFHECLYRFARVQGSGFTDSDFGLTRNPKP